MGAAVQRDRTESRRDLDPIARERQLHLPSTLQAQSIACTLRNDNSSGRINGNFHTIDRTENGTASYCAASVSSPGMGSIGSSP